MKRKKIEGDQLPIDELLPEAPAIDYKPVKKVLNKQPLYRVKKSRG
ncbi:hypothetical protein [Phormidesmis sp. 146-33]